MGGQVKLQLPHFNLT